MAPSRELLSRPRRAVSGLSEDIKARILREGSASSSSGSMPGPSLEALEELKAALPPQPVTISMVKASARDRSARARINQAKFIRRELIARRTHILTCLHYMPEPLGGQPAVAQLASMYWERLQALLERPEPQTEDAERDFFLEQRERNAQISGIGSSAEEQMCMEALGALQREKGADWWATQPEERQAVDGHLDGIFLARIGLRFLLEHYVACDEPRPGFAGVLETRCSPMAQLRDLAAETTRRLSAEFGAAPQIDVVGDESATFTFVPSHLRYVTGTLLRISGVATLRHHYRTALGGHTDGAGWRVHFAADTQLPRIRVVVAVSDDAVQLKLADEAGGIKRSSLINLWSYRSLDSAWWKPADGLSLPIARLYCKYFGGSLSLVPIEGYGTDCYISFNRLAQDNAEQILPVPFKSPSEEIFAAQSRRLR